MKAQIAARSKLYLTLVFAFAFVVLLNSSKVYGADQCCFCPIGSFLVDRSLCQDQSSSTDCCCQACPFLSTTNFAGATSIADCHCIPGSYGNVTSGCLSCPSGAQCDGSLHPTPKNGHMFSPINKDIIIDCHPKESCNPASQDGCGSGYKGDYCLMCEDKHYRMFNSCKNCPDYSYWRIFLPSLIMIYVIVSFYFQQFREHNDITSPYTPFMLLIHNLQVISTLPNMQFSWPEPVLELFYWLSSLNTNIQLMNLECSTDYMQDPINRWLLQVSLPLIVIVFYIIIFICYETSLYIKRTSYMEGIWGVQMKYTIGKLITATFRCLTLSYLMVCMATIELLTCEEEKDDVWHPKYQTSLKCFSDEWYKNNFAYGISGFFLLVIGIPLLNLYFIYKQQKDPENRLFSFLVSRYERHLYYWELVILVFRFLWSLLIRLSSNMVALQTILAVSLLFCDLYITAHYMPHTNKRNDQLSVFMKCGVLVIVLTGALSYYSVYENGYSNAAELGFTLAIFAVFIIILLSFTSVIRKVMKEKSDMNEERYRYYEELCRQIFHEDYRDISLRWFSQCSDQEKLEFAEAAEAIIRIIQLQKYERPHNQQAANTSEGARSVAMTSRESWSRDSKHLSVPSSMQIATAIRLSLEAERTVRSEIELAS